jgi:hypothetical protein
MMKYLVELIGTFFLVGNFAGGALAALAFKAAHPDDKQSNSRFCFASATRRSTS